MIDAATESYSGKRLETWWWWCVATEETIMSCDVGKYGPHGHWTYTMLSRVGPMNDHECVQVCFLVHFGLQHRSNLFFSIFLYLCTSFRPCSGGQDPAIPIGLAVGFTSEQWCSFGWHTPSLTCHTCFVTRLDLGRISTRVYCSNLAAFVLKAHRDVYWNLKSMIKHWS
jgi:hypothetical protein